MRRTIGIVVLAAVTLALPGPPAVQADVSGKVKDVDKELKALAKEYRRILSGAARDFAAEIKLVTKELKRGTVDPQEAIAVANTELTGYYVGVSFQNAATYRQAAAIVSGFYEQSGESALRGSLTVSDVDSSLGAWRGSVVVGAQKADKRIRGALAGLVRAVGRQGAAAAFLIAGPPNTHTAPAVNPGDTAPFALVRRSPAFTTLLGVQNAAGGETTVTVHFYGAPGETYSAALSNGTVTSSAEATTDNVSGHGVAEVQVPSGNYSATLSTTQPVVAVVNVTSFGICVR